ncbi:MAG: isoprenyl transferase [Firmicutes bacterium]|nr:isoprenyl transferase [Bacillota bacterium]
MKEEYADLLARIDKERLPKHIAVILDGNGRWAAARGLPRNAGHKAGVEAVRRLIEICREINVPSLTIYAFSTENWRRSADEVGYLMNLLVEKLYAEIHTMQENGVRYNFIGKREGLPDKVLKTLDKAIAETADQHDLMLNVALNYGGRDEIVRAVRRLTSAGLAPEEITEERLGEALDTAGQPELDLMIRPSGEYRISNFLLWQVAYSELVFMDKLWPDFGKRDLLEAVIEYQGRSRRFGGRPGK